MLSVECAFKSMQESSVALQCARKHKDEALAKAIRHALNMGMEAIAKADAEVTRRTADDLMQLSCGKHVTTA